MRRSKFSLSNYKLLSADMGEMIPIGLTEVLPGDTIQQSTNCLIRTQPLLAPVMHPVRVQIHHWYVPHRLIWDDFEDFITGGPTNTDASVYPTITIGGGSGAAVGSLADYLGVPTSVNNIQVSALPFRAYGLIFNEWYRDQDLTTPRTIDTTSGPDTTTTTTLANAAWEKDYFTSSRPWEQKGPSITIPLGTQAPIQGFGIRAGDTPGNTGQSVWEAGAAAATTYPFSWGAGENIELRAQTNAVPSATNTPQIFADLTDASAITVNALREALALQRYSEARARYGSRYVEYLRYLGVRSSDARLQRPEYLGGGKQTIQFSEVLQTAEGTDAVGTLRGHGIAAMRTNRYRKYFEEHGYIITLMICRPKTIYVQGLHRHWNRRVKEDFWQKELEGIGQQEVLNKEVYAAHASPDATFGYQDRYDEYRRTESSVAGEFRSTELDFWHMARIFSSSPALNDTFVTSVPTKRVFPVTDTDALYIMANHSIQARRLVAQTGKSFIY